jgi:hypothetical protein
VFRVWVVRDGMRVSTLDLVGDTWTLVAARNDTRWCECAKVAATQLGLNPQTPPEGTHFEGTD